MRVCRGKQLRLQTLERGLRRCRETAAVNDKEGNVNTGYLEKSSWLVAGIGIGAGATWLFATRGGRKAQRQVVRIVDDGREYLVKAGQDALEKGKDFYERGKELAEDARDGMASVLRIAR